MYPHHHVFLHRGASRLVWFLVGAGVATCWHRSAIMRDHRAQYFPCVMQPRQDADSAKSTWGPDQIAPGWQNQRDWERDRERWRHLQKRAGETVRGPLAIQTSAHTECIQAADLSESTLDSIVAAAESLKAVRTHLPALRQLGLIHEIETRRTSH
ncbi:hypothetical protein J3R82DRAFT_2441 [Butyriboletus roseoflavus]|nr:hypothetical protein J3R82DRAFT_2441 [Butyriboletus roseoflavus]